MKYTCTKFIILVHTCCDPWELPMALHHKLPEAGGGARCRLQHELCQLQQQLQRKRIKKKNVLSEADWYHCLLILMFLEEP